MAIDLTARRAQGHYHPSDTILMRNKREAIPEDFTAPPLPDEEGNWVGGQSPEHQQFQAMGDAATVISRARQANIGLTVVSPLKGLMPRGLYGKGGADAYAGNLECAAVVRSETQLRQWCIVNPRDPRTYEQAASMLGTSQCVGLKFHPEEHCYSIKDYGQELFRFAAEHGTVVLVHSGDRHSAPLDYLPFADAHPEIDLVLAHLGVSALSPVA